MIVQGTYLGHPGCTVNWLQWRDIGFELALYDYHDLAAWIACKHHYKREHSCQAFAHNRPASKGGWAHTAEVFIPHWNATSRTLVHEATHCALNYVQWTRRLRREHVHEAAAYLTEAVAHRLSAWASGDFTPAPDFIPDPEWLRPRKRGYRWSYPGPTYEFSTTPNERGGRRV